MTATVDRLFRTLSTDRVFAIMSIATNLNASVTGRGDHTIVLGNGIGTNQKTWRHVVDGLGDHCRVVRFDLVGTPDSDLSAYRADRYTTLHAHADDVVGLLDELDITDATFVGHSVCGMIGTLAAMTAPDRIAKLVLISASPRYVDDPDTGYVGGMSREAVEDIISAATADYHAWVAGFSPLVVGPDRTVEHVDEFASYLRRMRPDIAAQTLRTVFLSDHRNVLPYVTQPTVIVQTRSDIAVPAEVGQYFAAHLPSPTLREICATGHLPHLTAPTEIVSILLAELPSQVA